MAGAFRAASTTDEVLRGVDLNGRRVLVTGVSAGIGVETARSLAAHGAQVVGAARNLSKARAATEQVHDQAAEGGGGLELVQLDLASLASVRACADALVAVGKPFDLVIANAGIMAGPKRSTVDGFEAQFGINYLGHFVLINRIAGLLASGGRVVMVASAAIADLTSILRIRISSGPRMSNTSPMAGRRRLPSCSQPSSTGATVPWASGRRPSIRAQSGPRPFRR